MAQDKTGTAGPRRALPGADPYRCSWTTQGHFCLLPGEASRGLGEGTAYYCGWHFALLDSPRYQDDRQEFDRFVRAQRGAFTLAGALVTYCNTWAHWPEDALWAAARGELSLRLVGLREPSPCASESCPHRKVGPDRRATREESLEAIRGVRAMLEGKTGPMAETVERVVDGVPF